MDYDSIVDEVISDVEEINEIDGNEHRKEFRNCITEEERIAREFSDGVYTMYTCSTDNSICTWTMGGHGEKCVDKMQLNESIISAALYVQQMKLFVTGHDDGKIAIWNLFTQSLICSTEVHRNTVSCLLFIQFDRDLSQGKLADNVANRLVRESKYIITGGYDGQLGSISLTDYQTKLSRTPFLETKIQAHEREVVSLSFSPIKCVIVSGSNDGSIRIWTSKLECIKVLMAHCECVSALEVDGYFLFSGGEDAVIKVWDMNTWTHLKTVTLHPTDISQMSVLPDSGHIISVSRDGTILIWDYGTEHIIFKNDKVGLDHTVIGFDFRTSELLVGTSSGNIVRISTLEKQEEESQDIVIEEQIEEDNSEDNDSLRYKSFNDLDPRQIPSMKNENSRPGDFNTSAMVLDLADVARDINSFEVSWEERQKFAIESIMANIDKESFVRTSDHHSQLTRNVQLKEIRQK